MLIVGIGVSGSVSATPGVGIRTDGMHVALGSHVYPAMRVFKKNNLQYAVAGSQLSVVPIIASPPSSAQPSRLPGT